VSAAPPAPAVVLDVQGLSAGWGPMRVIHDLDLKVFSGERVGLVGLNGHGKSTLLQAIAGLTGWQRGSIRLNGHEVGRTRSQGAGRYTHLVVRRGLALIPQGDEIFHGLTVEEHLDSGAFTKRAWAERAARKRKILRIFPPLEKLMRVPVGRLSGGERRMVSIGRGLMADASLFLVDEPSLGLAQDRQVGHRGADGGRAGRLGHGDRRAERGAAGRTGGPGDRHARRSAEGRGVGAAARRRGGRVNVGLVLANALTLACIYGTLAIGLSVTWSSLGLVNMAYGFIFALSGYGAWLASTLLAPSPPLVMAAGILTGALGGLLVCLVAFIPVHDKPNFQLRALIATLAISLVGNQALLWWFGPRSKSLPRLFGTWRLDVLGVVVTADKVGASVSAILMLTLALLWMRSSRRGLEIRAMMMNPHAASLVGIGVRSTSLYVMALTGGLAGLASVLLSQTYYVAPFSGVTPMVKGLSIALVGGLGSVRGAVLGAVLLGINESLTSTLLGGQYVLITQFLLIILILLVRPRGIAGILDRAHEA
jgi:branched-chain amino acid transport system permease protein